MKVKPQEPEMEAIELPPLDPETIQALKEMGVRPPLGGTLPPFKPVKKRPPWLAFLLRITGRV